MSASTRGPESVSTKVFEGEGADYRNVHLAIGISVGFMSLVVLGINVIHNSSLAASHAVEKQIAGYVHSLTDPIKKTLAEKLVTVSPVLKGGSCGEILKNLFLVTPDTALDTLTDVYNMKAKILEKLPIGTTITAEELEAKIISSIRSDLIVPNIEADRNSAIWTIASKNLFIGITEEQVKSKLAQAFIDGLQKVNSKFHVNQDSSLALTGKIRSALNSFTENGNNLEYTKFIIYLHTHAHENVNNIIYIRELDLQQEFEQWQVNQKKLEILLDGCMSDLSKIPENYQYLPLVVRGTEYKNEGREPATTNPAVTTETETFRLSSNDSVNDSLGEPQREGAFERGLSRIKERAISLGKFLKRNIVIVVVLVIIMIILASALLYFFLFKKNEGGT